MALPALRFSANIDFAMNGSRARTPSHGQTPPSQSIDISAAIIRAVIGQSASISTQHTGRLSSWPLTMMIAFDARRRRACYFRREKKRLRRASLFGCDSRPRCQPFFTAAILAYFFSRFRRDERVDCAACRRNTSHFLRFQEYFPNCSLSPLMPTSHQRRTFRRHFRRRADWHYEPRLRRHAIAESRPASLAARMLREAFPVMYAMRFFDARCSRYLSSASSHGLLDATARK